MRNVQRTLGDLLHPLLKTPPEQKLDDLHLVRAGEKRRLSLLTAGGIDSDA